MRRKEEQGREGTGVGWTIINQYQHSCQWTKHSGRQHESKVRSSMPKPQPCSARSHLLHHLCYLHMPPATKLPPALLHISTTHATDHLPHCTPQGSVATLPAACKVCGPRVQDHGWGWDQESTGKVRKQSHPRASLREVGQPRPESDRMTVDGSTPASSLPTVSLHPLSTLWTFGREIRVCWDEELYSLELGVAVKQKTQIRQD